MDLYFLLRRILKGKISTGHRFILLKPSCDIKHALNKLCEHFSKELILFGVLNTSNHPVSFDTTLEQEPL